MFQKIADKINLVEEQGGLDQYGAKIIHAITHILNLKKKYDSIS